MYVYIIRIFSSVMTNIDAVHRFLYMRMETDGVIHRSTRERLFFPIHQYLDHLHVFAGVTQICDKSPYGQHQQRK